MAENRETKERGLWTLSQRRGLLVVIGAIVVALGIKVILYPTNVSDPQPEDGPSAAQLADRLDPNTATAAELAAIPEMGEKRPQAIVDFRDEFTARHPGKLAFSRAEDLLMIKGIGGATAEDLEPFLKFPGDRSPSPLPSP